MRSYKGEMTVRRRHRFSIVMALALTVAGVIGSTFVSAARTQDSRPRRNGTLTPPQQRATPTPTPSRAQTPAQASRPANPTPTPTPVPRGTPADRIAPSLGEPPPPPVLKPKPTPTPPEEVIDEDSIVRVNTELVTLNVRVIDRNNRPINNLNQNDFHVYEDGVPQPLEDFTREEVPISYGMAVDTSQSLRSQIQAVIDAGKTIVNSNKPGDETFLVRFISSDKIETLQDFTPTKDLLIDALDNLYVEGGQTAVIDAVYLTAEHVAEYKKGDDSDRRRRALIVITDGEDRASHYTQERLFARLREADVQIYVIGFVNELDRERGLIRKSVRDKAVNLINKLASETGGRAFFPESLSELPQIANEIVRDMRTQYVLAYNPTNKARDGSFRSIKVVVDEGASRDKRIALTRNGRVAPKGEPIPPKTTTPPRPKPTTGANRTP
ncbi:MAG TPA: VWA domain-containing protein [Pyrinomonadaceae bacterium]|nr:VWA domain-containing protein [Pyrinomonadaceae bacterium]